MTEPRPQFDVSTEEQASLHALQLLPAEDLRGFERQLAQDPALRELVRDLQANVEAEVFGEPAATAPLEVWGRISAQTQANESPLLPFPAPAGLWARRVLSAAACLAVGAGLHAWWSERKSPAVAQQPPNPVAPVHSRGGGPSSSLSETPPAPSRGNVAEAAPAPASRTQPTPATATNREVETALLQNRVRTLAAQVAALNQMLSQRVALPPGASRLHVFRLGTAGGTNLLGTAAHDGATRPQRLAEALIRQAAGPSAGAVQVPEANPPTNVPPVEVATTARPSDPVSLPINIVQVTPATPGSVGIAATVTGNELAEPAGWSPSVSLSTINPIVLFDPATGEGAIASSFASTDSTGTGPIQLQVWNQNSDGSFSSIGVFSTVAGSDTIATFNIPPEGHFNAPALSFEPIGGSFQPTSPVFGGVGNTNAPVGPP